MYHLPKGRRKRPGPVISPTMVHYPYRENRCMRRALQLRYVGASSSRVRLATPAGPSQRITRLTLPPSSPPLPTSLALFSPRRVSVPAPPTRPSLSSQSMASPQGLGPPAPFNWSPAHSFAPQQTSPLTLSGNPVDLCPLRLAAPTSAAPRRFPSPLKLDVTSPSALLKPRATAAATSSRDMLTSRLPVISACRAFSCRSASLRWRPVSPRWVMLSRKRRTSSVDGQCHWRPLGRPCETVGASERPCASPSPRRAHCCFSPPAPALPGP